MFRYLPTILLIGCLTPCYHNDYANITNYEVISDTSTPDGISVDSSGFLIDLNEIDRLVTEFENCYGTVNRECLTVKVAPDWYVSECSGQQLFPCDIDEAICIEQKKVTPTKECPCNCRAMIQDENTIIVTPDLRLLQGELARMVSGFNNPWIEEETRKCID